MNFHSTLFLSQSLHISHPLSLLVHHIFSCISGYIIQLISILAVLQTFTSFLCYLFHLHLYTDIYYWPHLQPFTSFTTLNSTTTSNLKLLSYHTSMNLFIHLSQSSFHIVLSFIHLFVPSGYALIYHLWHLYFLFSYSKPLL